MAPARGYKWNNKREESNLTLLRASASRTADCITTFRDEGFPLISRQQLNVIMYLFALPIPRVALIEIASKPKLFRRSEGFVSNLSGNLAPKF
jgi:hypothetical protein